MARKRSSSDQLICRIDVTGFAGVMLVLLFIFMAPIMTSIDRISPSVNLPRASNSARMPGTVREDAMIISLTLDGRLWFGQDRTSPEKLQALIHEALVAGAERKVYLKVDRYAKYGTVATVLNDVRFAGVENISFLVQWPPLREW